MSIPTILVIEDNFADVTILRLALDGLGVDYNLEVLIDGEAALQYIADRRAGRREPIPCAILLDLHLPKYNGIEVLHAIRQDPVLSDVHVIIFTCIAVTGEQTDIRTLGALLREKPADLKGFSHLAEEVIELCTNSSVGKAEASIPSRARFGPAKMGPAAGTK
jgi:CheY-like chemotaxis protein